MEEKKQTVWWWIAGAVIVALIIWALISGGVFDRGTLGSEEADEAAEKFMEEAEEFQETATQVTARIKARSNLLALEAEVKAAKDTEALAEKVEAIRAELKVAYAGASGTIEEEWESFDRFFNSLEDDIRAKATTTVQSLQDLAVRLEIKQGVAE